MIGKHAFQLSADPRCPNSCEKCGRLPNHPIHNVPKQGKGVGALPAIPSTTLRASEEGIDKTLTELYEAKVYLETAIAALEKIRRGE